MLSAVFLPMAFFGGSTGVIYRQFSLTIVSAMVLSVLVALILSPALTATLLQAARPTAKRAEAGSTAASRRSRASVRRGQDWFNRTSTQLVDRLSRRGRAR